MKMNDSVVRGENVSVVWARAFLRVASAARYELAPLIVNVDVNAGVQENADIRNLLDAQLRKSGNPTVSTVAATIFPKSLWNKGRPRVELYERYKRIWPRIQKVQQNRRGTYFYRFISFGNGSINQLENVLDILQKAKAENRGHRRSALQLAVLDPNVDHVHMPRLGFPCLQQVSIVPDSGGSVSVTGYYATQTVFEKAYGNYLGLIHLGQFVSQELQLPLSHVTCVASIGMIGQSDVVTKKAGREQFCQQLRAYVQGD